MPRSSRAPVLGHPVSSDVSTAYASIRKLGGVEEGKDLCVNLDKFDPDVGRDEFQNSLEQPVGRASAPLSVRLQAM